MKTFRFKTNLESGESIESVSEFIDEINGIKNWEVDVKSPDKVLTVRGDHFTTNTVMDALDDAGYDGMPLD